MLRVRNHGLIWIIMAFSPCLVAAQFSSPREEGPSRTRGSGAALSPSLDSGPRSMRSSWPLSSRRLQQQHRPPPPPPPPSTLFWSTAAAVDGDGPAQTGYKSGRRPPACPTAPLPSFLPSVLHHAARVLAPRSPRSPLARRILLNAGFVDNFPSQRERVSFRARSKKWRFCS